MKKKPIPFGVAALGILAISGFGVGVIASQSESSEQRLGASGLNVTTVTTTYDADTQYVGKCGIVTPPDPDPCDAAQLVIRYQFIQSMWSSTPFKNWAKGNMKDLKRLCVVDPAVPADAGWRPCLTGFMVGPVCSTGTHPYPMITRTKFGNALEDAFEAYACALGTESLDWPPEPPPPPTSGDTTPPSAPQLNPISPSG